MEILIGGIFLLLLYISYTYGLFLINKKLGEKNAWLSFIPVVQYWSIAKASGKSFFWYIIFPTLLLILLQIFTGLAFVLSPTISLVLGILLIPAIIYSLVAYIIVLHGISKRTGHGVLMTIGNIFIPFILFPIVGYQLKDSSKKEEENTDIEL